MSLFACFKTLQWAKHLFPSFAVFDKKASIDGHENGDLGNSVETKETVSKLAHSGESLA